MADSLNLFNSIPAILHRMVDFTKSLHEIELLRISLTDLNNGVLSPMLVNQSIIHNTLASLDQYLGGTSPRLYSVYKHAAEIYRSGDFLLTIHNNTLFITVSFPLSATENALSVYKMHIFPVLFNQDSQHMTILNDENKFFLIDEQMQTGFIQSKNTPRIKHRLLEVSRNNYVLRTMNSDSCILALFSDNERGVSQWCDFHYLPNVRKPTIFPVGHFKFVFVDISNISLLCKNNSRVVQFNTSQIIYEQPCWCAIQAESFFYLCV